MPTRNVCRHATPETRDTRIVDRAVSLTRGNCTGCPVLLSFSHDHRDTAKSMTYSGCERAQLQGAEHQ